MNRKRDNGARRVTAPLRMALTILCIALCGLALASCDTGSRNVSREKPERLRVVTSLFPMYDFARTIAGDRADVSLLLPPGVEPHNFEPKPDDIVRIGKAGLFVYTGPIMEPWAAKIIESINRKGPRTVEAGKGVSYQTASLEDTEHDHDHSHQHSGGADPHIWLDFNNDQKIVDNILAGFTAADPANTAHYRSNASALKARLSELDKRYQAGLASCASRVLLHGGHYTFGYLARRYDLRYHALSGVSSESEPTATRMTAMIRAIRREEARYLFAEELLSPRLTETLAKEAGVGILRLHGAHNLSREDFLRGVSFFDLMDNNLSSLRKGLACR